jgi:hypothetical protein
MATLVDLDPDTVYAHLGLTDLVALMDKGYAGAVQSRAGV